MRGSILPRIWTGIKACGYAAYSVSRIDRVEREHNDGVGVFFLEPADLRPPGWVRTPPKVRLRTIRMSTTVLIVDDSTPIRRSLRAWFEQRDGWEVCGEAENGAVAVE